MKVNGAWCSILFQFTTHKHDLCYIFALANNVNKRLNHHLRYIVSGAIN